MSIHKAKITLLVKYFIAFLLLFSLQNPLKNIYNFESESEISFDEEEKKGSEKSDLEPVILPKAISKISTNQNIFSEKSALIFSQFINKISNPPPRF